MEESPLGLHVFERAVGRVLFETPVKRGEDGQGRGGGEVAVAESPVLGERGAGGGENSIYDALGWNDDDDFM